MRKKILMLAILAVALAVFGCFGNDQPAGPQTQSSKYPEGNASAGITITIYSDFQCPFCAIAAPEVNRFVKDHSTEVKLEFRDFPLSSQCNSLMQNDLHPFGCKAAQAAECAADQKKFWEYHNKLFENQKNIGVGDLKKDAADLGLNSAQFDKCLDSQEKLDAVKKDIGQEIAIGVDSTPTIYMNGRQVQFSRIEQVYSGLDAALANAKKGN